jgi:CBS domain-containing protein
MTQTVQDVMTANPTVLDASTSLQEAARRMRDGEIGDVLVQTGDDLCGIVTDRDIVVRAVAERPDLSSATLEDICSHQLIAISPTDAIETAVQRMREHAVRRLPVLRDGEPVGIVSIGDLAVDRDPGSALADISAAPSNG